MAYGWGVAFGTLYSILIALSSWMVWFLAVYSENVTPEEEASNDWLVFAAKAMFVAAVAFWIGVMTVRLWLVVPAFLVSGMVSVAAVWYAIVEASDHGDGELIALTFGCGLAGSLAVVLVAIAAREPVDAT